MKPITSLSIEPAAADASRERAADHSVASQSPSLRSILELCAWFDCRRAAEIALAIAERLDEAERSGASPLGLQPECIRVCEGEQVSVVIEDRTDDVSARVSAHYLSPEEVRGETPDSRSDLYALGAVLYEMLTDRVPFDGRDADAIKQRHLHRPPEPPKIFRTDVPEALSNLVMRLLEKDPARRPQRAADLFVELQQVIEAEMAATRRSQAKESRQADVLVLADYAPGHNGNAQRDDGEDESILDLEFNDLFAAESSKADDTTSNSFADEPFIAPTISAIAPRPSHGDTNQSDRDEAAPMADGRVASTFVEAGHGSSLERDPFDLPPVSPAAREVSLTAAAVPLEGRSESKLLEEKRAPAETGDARLRWVALLILCIVAAAALLLYIVIRPAATRSDDTATPLHTSPAIEQTLPANDPPVADAAQPNAGEGGNRSALSDSATGPVTSASSSRTSPTSVRRPRAQASQWKRKASSSYKAHSSKRKKHSRAHRAISTR